jgi:hypothetical protein
MGLSPKMVHLVVDLFQEQEEFLKGGVGRGIVEDTDKEIVREAGHAVMVWVQSDAIHFPPNGYPIRTSFLVKMRDELWSLPVNFLVTKIKSTDGSAHDIRYFIDLNPVLEVFDTA